jgi:hypothetical protein
MAVNKLFLTGVDGETGRYWWRDMDARTASSAARSERRVARTRIDSPLGLPFGVEPNDVTQAGWTLVVHANEDEKVLREVERLLEHRSKNIPRDRVKKLIYKGADTTPLKWLERHGMYPGQVDPTKVPFYILVVGSPDRIPFDFEHQLGLEYSVGRLDFDTPEEYGRYVESLIAYETRHPSPPSGDLVFFSPRHAFDPATQLSADMLIEPLVKKLTQNRQNGAKVRCFSGDKATKASLKRILAPRAQEPAPSLLFTASHGVCFQAGHTLQRASQGALVCQDWPEPGAIAPKHYFSGRDVPAESRLTGTVSFHFACFGAGTPKQNRFQSLPGARPENAAASFIAALPKALLAHPNGGALACIGHVDQALSYSITGTGSEAQIQPFENAIRRILSGLPVGLALKDFRDRYATLAAALSAALEAASYVPAPDDDEIADLWVQRNDAEGYVILGDPAAKIAPAAPATAQAKPPTRARRARGR